MTDTTRLIVNTLAQNVRSLLNIVLSLYATRIVMDSLGQSDYGIYMLVAGIVSLLSYLVNALVTTTQRHLSYSYGRKDSMAARSIFANSLLLHCLGAAVLCCIALMFTNPVFNHGWLNIPADKVGETKIVYVFVVSSVFFTFITAPFRALLIAHENIVYISIVDVLDGVLKLALVFTLYLTPVYRLPLYAAIVSFIMLVNLVLLAGYSKLHYEECILMPRLEYYKKEVMSKIVGFATWTLYGTFCIFVRTQGVAVVLNRIFGTLINAAYGVATQVFGSIQFLSEALLNAIRPQIFKAEGNSDRKQMLFLSECASKYCFFLLALFSVPLMVEMPSILSVWLGDVPEYAALFCRTFIIASLIDQLSIGLGVANSAIGRIRNYTLLVFSIKAATVIAIWALLHTGHSIVSAMAAYVAIELIASIVRVPFLAKTAGLNVLAYIRNVYLKALVPMIAMTATSMACLHITDHPLRFFLTFSISIPVGCAAIWLFGTVREERAYVMESIHSKLKKRNDENK